MSLFGINTNKENPEFTINDFIFWLPQFKDYMETEKGIFDFNKLYPIANKKIFVSIFGADWEMAMSLCIAHYLQLRADGLAVPSGKTLAEIAGGGNIKGILSQASVGQFSKSYDIDKTVLSNKESAFWNQTSYGASLMALLANKPVPSIFVVTSGPLYPNNKRRPRFPFVENNEGE